MGGRAEHAANACGTPHSLSASHQRSPIIILNALVSNKEKGKKEGKKKERRKKRKEREHPWLMHSS